MPQLVNDFMAANAADYGVLYPIYSPAKVAAGLTDRRFALKSPLTLLHGAL